MSQDIDVNKLYAEVWNGNPHAIDTFVERAVNNEKAIKRVRELHKKVTGAADDFTCQACLVDSDWYPEWPCPTIKALDGEK